MRRFAEMTSRSIVVFLAAAVLTVIFARAQQTNAPVILPATIEGAKPLATVTPPGLPAIGKWMIAPDGTVAHWLGEIYENKRLREPINVILLDEAAGSAEEAKERLVAAATAAGYPIRFGHSTGYRALIGGQSYAQLPAGRDDAFSNGIFELSNNHGRLFGSHRMGAAYVASGAFSREEVRPFRWPQHQYASFNRARDDFSQRLDRITPFKLSGFVNLLNALIDDPHITTGDHDGLAVLLRAARK